VSVHPDAPIADVTSSVTVYGSQFEPGLTVAFGSEYPTPTNLTSTRFDVLVGPQSPGPTTVPVTNPGCGEQGEAGIVFRDDRVALVSSVTCTSNLGGLAGADAKCNRLAAAAGLTGSYMAWMSVGVDDPDSRFPIRPKRSLRRGQWRFHRE